uniref:Secreted protein n=1 Tax=Oryza brachyantha TaxID=4533 RepID=J3KXZ2_ORYBR
MVEHCISFISLCLCVGSCQFSPYPAPGIAGIPVDIIPAASSSTTRTYCCLPLPAGHWNTIILFMKAQSASFLPLL